MKNNISLTLMKNDSTRWDVWDFLKNERPPFGIMGGDQSIFWKVENDLERKW
jgi:hypothetical protein